jgi:parallel beta-helix repeat protein
MVSNPTVSIAPASPLSLDIGQVQTFTATATGGSGSYVIYRWFVNGTFEGSSSTYSFSEAAAGTYTVYATVTDSGDVPSAPSNTVTVTVSQARPIYILANGDISPSTAPIKQNGNYYTLTGNITGIPDGIIVQKSNVTIDGAGYTLTQSGPPNGYGFNLTGVNLVTIKNTIITNFEYGIWLFSSSNNIVSGNNITNNANGIYLDPSSSGNIIYHNDFVNNIRSAYANGSVNVWDNGYPSGGNYWSDYLTQNPSAAENDSSGFWNIPYVIGTNNTDRYPLMGQFHAFTAITLNGITYQVNVVSNSTTVTNFSFNATSKTIMFTVAGQTGTTGFCLVAIPTSLLKLFGINLADWTVMIDGHVVTPVITVSGGYTYIYFSYHHSTHQVTITGYSTIPEFQPLFFLPLFMIATLVAAFVLKRKRNAKI